MSYDVRSDAFQAAFARDAAERLACDIPLKVQINFDMAIGLIASLQLALRFPGNTGPISRTIRGFVGELIDRVATTEVLRAGLEAGFDPHADVPAPPLPATGPWFHAWYRAMPQEWQAGLWEAIHGGAWTGELEARKAAGGVQAVVFFVHPSLAGRVQQALEKPG